MNTVTNCLVDIWFKIKSVLMIYEDKKAHFPVLLYLPNYEYNLNDDLSSKLEY